LAEETFFRLVENALADVSTVFDPVRQVEIPVGDFSQLRTRTGAEDDSGAAAAALGASGRVVGHGPTGDRMVYEVRQRALWKNSARVVVEARSVLRADRFAADGRDDQPFAAKELESLLNRISRQAADDDTWHLAILASPTGWADEALQMASGAGTHPFRDRLVSVVLYDRDQSRFCWAETDERLAAWREAFSADLNPAALERARQWIGRHFAQHTSVALATLVEQLGISRKAADQVCRILAAEGLFVCESVKDIGPVLSKKL
jgi:hypothetical protein